jgi:hypothetical protein
LVEGKFRGQTGTSRHREIPKICLELSHKGVDLIVFLTDSNVNPWREVKSTDAEKCPPNYQHLSVFGVCCRNAECWLASDTGHIARHSRRNEAEFRQDDPKGIVESVFGITGTDKQEEKIADFVRNAPLHRWLTNPSFEDFFDPLWQKSRERGCRIENLREPPR